MKVKFLGTAAAEGMPAVFCNCDACRRAKQEGGKNIRTRSQILVDDCILIDFPPDTYMHALNCGFDLSAAEYVLITHAHHDHFYPLELIMHGSPFAYGMTKPHLNVYGNKTVVKKTKQFTKGEFKQNVKDSVSITTLKPYDTALCGGYTVTALPAEHTRGEDCLIYLIEKDGKTYLQFNDSGILPDSVYDYLKKTGAKIDLVSFDCTYGYMRRGAGRHMGALDNADERERMRKRGIVHENTKYVLTHFSHNCALTHSELTEKVADMKFIVAFDGMETEI